MANEHNNKRPTAASMLNIAAFCTALFAVGGLSIAMEKPTYSEQEKRDLAKMPELTLKGYWDGSLASGIDAFYSDTFPFRDALISLGSTLEEMRGLRLDDAKIHETAPSHRAGQRHRNRELLVQQGRGNCCGRTEWLGIHL